MPDHYLIIDLEATCCDRKSIPDDEREIIEIGAVMVESATFTQVDQFQSFVQAVRHPFLTAFCSRLTGIQQHDLDDAPRFPAVISAFAQWLATYPSFVFGSWGSFDQRQLAHDCAFHQISNPIDAPYLNLRQAFINQQGTRKGLGLREALRLAGLDFEGHHHRGLDDARNISRLLPFCLGQQTLAGTAKRQSYNAT